MAEKIASRAAQQTAASDYLFHLDALPPQISFRRRVELTGWLLHRHGRPIHGLRGIVKSSLRHARSYKGRRKHARPAIGAAYQDIPEAGVSGFLLEIDHLPLGGCELEIQVKDHEKNWRTIFGQRMQAFPLDFLGRLGLREVQKLLVRQLEDSYAGTRPNLTLDAGELEEIEARLSAAESELAPAAIKTVRLFATSKSNLFIIEIAQLVCAGFREAGFRAELFVDHLPEEKMPNDTIQIVVTPHEFYNLFLTPKLPLERVRKLTRQLYLLGTEQPESDWFHSNLLIAPYARAMLDINSLGVGSYRARGLRCFHLPLGYHPMLERTNSEAGAERDLDLCLLGSLTDRREKFLAAHADFFARRKCHLRLVPITFAKTEETKSYLPVNARNALLQRTKILLNVHYSDLRYFEWHRMLVGLANGCCIITETCEGFAPLVPGKHFVMVEPEELVRCCDYYLEHPAEREAIARAGRDFVRERLTQASNCVSCVRQIESGHPFSLGEVVQPDRTAGDLVAETGGESGSKLFWRALRQDIRNFFQPTERAPITIAPLVADTETLQAVRERRHDYATRFALQEDAGRSDAEAWRISDNEAFRKSATPAISVVITLYNYARYIRQCVRSLEEAALAAIPGGIEVLIVDDASTDRSLREARQTQRDSPLPIRLVGKKFNTGLADARNVGLRWARAPYAFIMDADNLIFPLALEQLYMAITESGAAAAYSILCRFHGQPDNRSGLLSYYDWDPRMLVEFPYIDAMALFDREKLIALGGYDNDLFKIGWFGWEDYELWLRMAAAHLRAAFVPNILCLYRHHEASMSNTTNLFETDLVRHLIARYQRLLDEYQPKDRVFGVEWAQLQPNERSDA
jgi:GT2 family glycosyltransferase